LKALTSRPCDTNGCSATAKLQEIRKAIEEDPEYIARNLVYDEILSLEQIRQEPWHRLHNEMDGSIDDNEKKERCVLFVNGTAIFASDGFYYSRVHEFVEACGLIHSEIFATINTYIVGIRIMWYRSKLSEFQELCDILLLKAIHVTDARHSAGLFCGIGEEDKLDPGQLL